MISFVRLFDLWFDRRSSRTASISASAIWTTGRPSFWGAAGSPWVMAGCRFWQFVVEGDGGVSQDFYVLDEWRLGNIGENWSGWMRRTARLQKDSFGKCLPYREECKTRQWFGLCRNGCCRDRDILPSGVIGQNIYSYGIQKFFSERFRQLAHRLSAFSVCSSKGKSLMPF